MKEPKREDLAKVLIDVAEEITSTLAKEGYKLRAPRAEWSIFRSAVIITYEDKSTKEIYDDELEKILDGKKSPSELDGILIQEWYAISSYRIGYEIDKLEKKLRKAKNAKNVTNAKNAPLIKECERKIEELVEEKKWSTLKDVNKRQLAYYYKEEGERLERLYQIIHGRNESVNLRFGVVDVSVDAKSYERVKDSGSYEQSKGFFEDLENAYNFIQGFKGEVNFSPSAGAAYTDEFAFGNSKGSLKVGEKKFSLEAKIRKEGIKNSLSCSISIDNLKLNRAELISNIACLLPGYLADYDEGPVIVENEEKKVMFFYCGNTLNFSGEPQVLKEEIPKILGVIIR
ncbi:hypothetical protein HZA97_05520 [Candidatus Woesearchaeota archaeon]|nr:hypothetical protein [Candidatus Woesearchaeota archaeon]